MQPTPRKGKPKSCATETELVRFKQSPIHGRGGFAKTNIPKGTRVLEYLGERIDKKESAHRCEQNNVYIFSLNEHEDIDGNVEWNPPRFLNHCCSPNCETRVPF